MKFQKRRVYFQDTRLSKNIILQKYKKSDEYTPVDNILDGKVFFLFFFFFAFNKYCGNPLYGIYVCSSMFKE